jgi:hypothetical protein
VLEKLLENWLDSASERSYQQAFVQMLSARGYTVVHSTRHSALEFGKDILAVAPNGVGCAYQLKGNPGGRLGLSQFRKEVQPQLVQLLSQAIVFPGFPSGRHTSFLVTNGYFDEEVQRAADDLNRNRSYPSRLQLVSRGDLLKWSKQLGASLWPSELDVTQQLLKLFLANPRDLLPVETLAPLVSQLLGLTVGAKRFGRAQMDRAIPAAALLVGIATANFAEEDNHLAMAWAWTYYIIAVLGTLERHRLRLAGTASNSVALAEAAISDSLVALWKEIQAREDLVEGNPLADHDIYSWRTITLLGAMSCLAFRHESSPCMTPSDFAELNAWLLRKGRRLNIWGEGAMASMVSWLVWIQKHEPTNWSDAQIHGLTSFIIATNQRDSKVALANPYNSFESIYRQTMPFGRPLKRPDKIDGSSHTALLMYYLLARTNLKQACRNLWPDLTRLHHRTLIPDYPWEYCSLSVRSGVDETTVLPPEYAWSALRTDARKDCRATLPRGLTQRPWLLGLWWQIAPQRLTPDASRVFANEILPTWGK